MSAPNVARLDPVLMAPASVRLLEEAFLRGDHYFRELLDALPVAVYVTDADGRIIFFNEACIEFSGRTPVIGSDRAGTGARRLRRLRQFLACRLRRRLGHGAGL